MILWLQFGSQGKQGRLIGVSSKSINVWSCKIKSSITYVTEPIFNLGKARNSEKVGSRICSSTDIGFVVIVLNINVDPFYALDIIWRSNHVHKQLIHIREICEAGRIIEFVIAYFIIWNIFKLARESWHLRIGTLRRRV